LVWSIAIAAKMRKLLPTHPELSFDELRDIARSQLKNAG
jgi:hypothetical protein